MSKFIFITGGVVSGLGKGVVAASLGRILKECGLKIAAQKLDPYINVDPGTMNPYQHGEVFVTDDGTETDLDIGHYERFIDENLNKYSNLTAGRVYWNVLEKERAGEYLGETVQVIPHITDEIKKFIYTISRETNADIVITEIGGTVGDIEIQPFIESARQIFIEKNNSDCLFIHVTLVPFNEVTSEYKSKPTQHSVKELRSLGIIPDIIITRSKGPVGEDIKGKIALFCNVLPQCVIENVNLNSIYEAPSALEGNGFSEIVIEKLKLDCKKPDLAKWKNSITCKQTCDLQNGQIQSCYNSIKKNIIISIVGKYIQLKDAYLSILESINHASLTLDISCDINWIDSQNLTKDNIDFYLKKSDAILVPGGFGSRGVEGMILAANYSRENNVPYFGICLGMQISIIEYARNILNFKNANSTEFDKNTEFPVIDLMERQKVETGGTMRLGSYPCILKKDTLIYKCYNSEKIHERHRHRFEFNNKYLEDFEKKGIIFSGKSPNELLIETIEFKNHKFYIGVQFHPEFKSRPGKPHPLFKQFLISAASE